MKLRAPATLLLVFAYFFGLAQTNPLRLKITANYQEQSLKNVLEDLENRYPVYFYYTTIISENKPVSVTIDQLPLEQALSMIFNDAAIGYEAYGDNAVIIADVGKLNQSYSQAFFQAREQAANAVAEDDALEVLELGNSSAPDTDGQIEISGFINDDKSEEPIIGATLFAEPSGQGGISDETGQYTLSLPIGEHQVRIQSVGYEDKEVIVKAYSDGNIDFLIAKEAILLNEVVVKDNALDRNVKSTVLGLETLSAKELKKLPAFMGEVDVIKSIQLLPGVSNVGEGASGFNVRGGNVDQNLTVLDGMLLFNTSHALGLFSLFNPDLVQSVDLYKGSMPAKYGGRLSSVLDVKLREGNYKKFSAKGGIGLVSSRLSLEAPIVKGKTSVIFGGRTSYSDWIFDIVNVVEVQESGASFYDATLKIAQRLGKRGKFAISGYTSQDRFKYAAESDFKWETQGGNFNFNYLISDKFSFSLDAVASQYESSLADPLGSQAFNLNNGILTFGARPEFLLNQGKHTITFGSQWTRYEVSQGELTPGNDISNIIARALPQEQGQVIGIYAQDDFEINEVLALSVGLRYSIYQNLGPEDEVFVYAEDVPRTVETIIDTLSFSDGEVIQSYNGLEPRVSLKIGLNPSSSIKLSYNRTQQFINQITNTTAVSPVDIWQLSNSNIEPTRAHNYSTGYFKNFDNNKWQTSIEVFYRDIDNLIEYKNRADLLVNEHVETELLAGQGRAYGLELSVKKSVGRWNGWLGYTYSRTERLVTGNTIEETINFGEWFPSNFDRPHDMSLVASYQLSKRSNFSVNFVWSSGRPTSAPIGKFGVENVENISNYSGRNQYRIPDYHRLDLAYTINTNHKKNKIWEGSWTFSLFNVYGRRNAFSVFFTQSSFQAPKANRLAILGSPFPSLTYNFKFL